MQKDFILFIPLPHCSIYPSSLKTLAITLFLISDLPFKISSSTILLGKAPGDTMFTMYYLIDIPFSSHHSIAIFLIALF